MRLLPTLLLLNLTVPCLAWAAAPERICERTTVYISGNLPAHARSVAGRDSAEAEQLGPEDRPTLKVDTANYGFESQQLNFRVSRTGEHRWLIEQLGDGLDTQGNRETIARIPHVVFRDDGTQLGGVGAEIRVKPARGVAEGDRLTINVSSLTETDGPPSIAVRQVKKEAAPCYEPPKNLGVAPMKPLSPEEEAVLTRVPNAPQSSPY
jgi:hypothetical protein